MDSSPLRPAPGTALVVALVAVLVILIVVALAARVRRRPEGFYWADWAENDSRENFRERYDQRRRRRERLTVGPAGSCGASAAIWGAENARENFSPDMPGSCRRAALSGRAARAEAAALGVLSGSRG